MLSYELDAIIEGYQNKHKQSWEQARLIAYVTAQVNSSKKLNPSDIITFNWDSENGNMDDQADWEEIKKMRERIKQMNDGKKQ
ncbi:MAG: hypothetical protein RR397_09335 [Odoribacter sp.]